MRSVDLCGTSCVVLGGGGFIGTSLCRALARQGAHVRGFGRRRSYPEALADIPWMTGDFDDRAALAHAVEGMEVVFHLVGHSTPESSNLDPVGDLQASAVASLHLLDLCRASGIQKVVFVSSGGTVYGIPARVPIPEAATTDPICAYGISKLAVEKYLQLYRHLYGLNYTVLRVANPFGPFQDPTRRQGVVAALLERALSGQRIEVWGDGRVVRDFVFIDDVVEALIMVLGYAGPHHVFNVGSGVGRSILDVVSDIERALECAPIALDHKPGRAADVPVNVLDISLIGRELNWRPATSWQEGLRRTAKWLQMPPR